MSSNPIDLRSDTLTLPTAEMRAAMAAAPLGDDVFCEEPTVTALEQQVAALAGKEKGLYVPSGTMSNLIAMMIHGEGLFSEIIVGDASHVACYEVGGSSGVGRVMLRQIPTAEDGTLPLPLLERAVQTDNVHNTITRAIVLENTHNARGGRVLSQEYVQSVRALCDRHHLQLHADGARMWNAAVALGLPLVELAKPFDTVSLCLSKGLGAPVGSVLVGPAPFIAKARRVRKMLGGGMRQAGVIAAGGIFAIENNFARLAEDHQMASFLGEQLVALGFARVITPETNIVIWSVGTSDDRAKFLKACTERGLLLVGMGPEGNVRAIPHLGNTMDDMKAAVAIIAEAKKAIEQ